MRATRVSEDIIGVSELRSRTAELLDRVAKTGAPLIVTQHGRAAGVLLSPAVFDELTGHKRFVAAVDEGLAEDEAGLGVEHDEAVKRLQARFGPGVAPRTAKKGRRR